MSVTNFSMIWTQLASPFQAAGGVPFVATDNASITMDVTNFFYDPINFILNVTNGVAPYSFNANTLPSPVTNNRPAGIITMAAGTSSVVVNCSAAKGSAASLVFAQRRNNDATATLLAVNVTGPGQFTVTANANTTNAMNISYFVLNTQVQSTAG